jgi:hypothetical protein
MPRITCPTCGAVLEVTDDMVGTTVECGGCQAQFVARVDPPGSRRSSRRDDEEDDRPSRRRRWDDDDEHDPDADYRPRPSRRRRDDEDEDDEDRSGEHDRLRDRRGAAGGTWTMLAFAGVSLLAGFVFQLEIAGAVRQAVERFRTGDGYRAPGSALGISAIA